MTTITKAFTAAGFSDLISFQPGQSVTYSSSGTFTGYLRFQRSRTQGATWETIEAPAVDTNVVGATIKNNTKAEERYRFALFDTDAVTPVTGTATAVFADAVDVVRELRDDNGRVYTTVDDSGVNFLGAVEVAGALDVAGAAEVGGNLALEDGLDFNGLTPPASVILFTGVTLPANSNILRGIDVVPTRVSGWTAFTGTVGATPAQVYTDYRELHTNGVAEVLGFGSFPYMDSGASCKSMFGGQDIAYVSTGATVTTAADAPATGIFSRWGKVVIDGATFNAGGVAAGQFLSFQANVTNVQAEDTSMVNWEVASGGIQQMIKFRCSAAKGATYLVNFTDDNSEPVSLTNTGVLNDISATANAGWIRVKVGSSDRYIPLYELKA